MNGQKAVSIAQVGQVYFDEWVSITSAATAAVVRDLMGNDQVVLGVHRRLHVVAHHRRALGTVGGHGSCVGISLGELTIRDRIQLRLNSLQFLHALAHFLNLSLQALGLSLHLRGLSPIRSLQCL